VKQGKTEKGCREEGSGCQVEKEGGGREGKKNKPVLAESVKRYGVRGVKGRGRGRYGTGKREKEQAREGEREKGEKRAGEDGSDRGCSAPLEESSSSWVPEGTTDFELEERGRSCFRERGRVTLVRRDRCSRAQRPKVTVIEPSIQS
jgi:hypothetical protein